MSSRTVLFVTDEESQLDSRQRALESSGFSVVSASSGTEALTTFTSRPVDAVVLDCSVPETDCARVPHPIKQMKPRTPVIVLNGPALAKEVSSVVDAFIGQEDASSGMLLHHLDSLLRLRSHSHPELQSKYVIFADSSRRYLDCSDGVCELLGYPRMELIGMTIDDVSYSQELVAGLFENFLRRGEQDGDYVLRHKTGHPVLIRYRSYIFSDGCIAAVWEPIAGWRVLYTAALVEADPVKLRERVDAARAAIEARMRELENDNQLPLAEWRALQDAAVGVNVLSRESLE